MTYDARPEGSRQLPARRYPQPATGNVQLSTRNTALPAMSKNHRLAAPKLLAKAYQKPCSAAETVALLVYNVKNNCSRLSD